MVSALMFLTCGGLYGKGKKILQQAVGKLRSQALARGPEWDREIHGKVYVRRAARVKGRAASDFSVSLWLCERWFSVFSRF